MWQSIPVTHNRSIGYSDGAIHFVWLTDNHVAALGDAADINYQLAIRYANRTRPHMLVNTGDQNTYGVQSIVGNAISRAKDCHVSHPVIALGNHDTLENPRGTPVTAWLTSRAALGFGAPFYETFTIRSGDGSLTARVFVLESNFFDGPDDAFHVEEQRIAYHADNGIYNVRLGVDQRAWIAATLAADTTSDIVLFFVHYNVIGDDEAVANIFVADGRPTLGFCGHTHGDARYYYLTATDTTRVYMYKTPAMSESGSFCDVALSLSGGAIVVDKMELQNYTDPGGWTVNLPFTVAA